MNSLDAVLDTTTSESNSIGFSLNSEQEAAIMSMEAFLTDSDPDAPQNFLLSGYAGTGKTFCVKQLVKQVRGKVAFTAPTNKATKVLRDTLAEEGFRPLCKTIHSLLGLTMGGDGEVKELKASDEKVDLSSLRYVVVDEGSMVGEDLLDYILDAQRRAPATRFIFMGDPAQLPPVREKASPIWNLGWPSARLEKVMRHDNQILTFATEVRAQVDRPIPRILLQADNDGRQGVFRENKILFMNAIATSARNLELSVHGTAKIVAWRNVTVDQYNRVVRQHLFAESAGKRWLPTDRIILTAPAKDLEDNPMASTDDEGTVDTVTEDYHPIEPSFLCYRLGVTLDDNRHIVLWALHPQADGAYARRVERLGAEARADRRRWKDFWEFKELFHQVRHSYAITAHRSQGSTYLKVFGDATDILANQNRREAYQCLYVMATRPKEQLWLA